jgi:hypothetical protein
MCTLASYAPLLWRIFFLGLLFQFLAHTLVTYWLWLNYSFLTPLRLWKEFLLLFFAVICAILFWVPSSRAKILRQRHIIVFVLCLLCVIGFSAYIQLGVLYGGIQWFLVALKYNFVWFIIVALVLVSGVVLHASLKEAFVHWALRLMKWLLIGWLVWYMIIFIKPWTLKLFWYDNFVYEWTVGSAPPAAYYTHLNYWIPRNQFLFERPTTRWFFLVAMRPLFYLSFLYKKPLRDSLGWRIIYGSNIFITFSRAAWWVWLIQTILLTLFLYSFRWKRVFWWIVVPIGLVLVWLLIVWWERVLVRDYSNTWHVAMVIKWWNMWLEKPLWWWWGGYAGPWSHHGNWWAFNPENQFLQIMIEFGLFGALAWMIVYWWLHLQSRLWFAKSNWSDDGVGIPEHYRLWSFGVFLWLAWLSISGMVLHSLADRMVVYPFFLLVWVIFSLLSSRTSSL